MNFDLVSLKFIKHLKYIQNCEFLTNAVFEMNDLIALMVKTLIKLTPIYSSSPNTIVHHRNIYFC